MTSLRRTTQLLGVSAIGLVGLLLVLESSEVIGGQWRSQLASGLNTAAAPGWGLWASALLGAALALLGVTFVAAQLAPPKKGLSTMHEVYRGSDGETNIRGRAAVNAVRHELDSVEGVVAVDARVVRKGVEVELKLDDRADVSQVEEVARQRLDHEFWINLGLADFSVNILITHDPKPPRVR